MGLIVVTGPPAAGKTTWVRARARRGDVVVDFDHLAAALGLADPDEHEHSPVVVAVAKAARRAAVRAALPHTASVDVYVIDATPSAATLGYYRRAGARVVVVDPGRAVVTERCRRYRSRPMLAVVDRWYREHAKSNQDQRMRSREW